MAPRIRQTVGEQRCGQHKVGGPGTYEHWLKRQANRLMRRWARRDPEGAPRKFKFRGYSD
jgi:hypothetical protein